MGSINYEYKRENFNWPRIGSLVGCYAMGGRRHAGIFYTATSWGGAMIHVEEILLRGNSVSVVNVAGKYVIKETISK